MSENITKFGIVSVALFVALTGCGKPTIDATTDKSFSSTLLQVRSTVSESKIVLFDETIEIALKDIKYVKDSEKKRHEWALKPRYYSWFN